MPTLRRDAVGDEEQLLPPSRPRAAPLTEPNSNPKPQTFHPRPLDAPHAHRPSFTPLSYAMVGFARSGLIMLFGYLGMRLIMRSRSCRCGGRRWSHNPPPRVALSPARPRECAIGIGTGSAVSALLAFTPRRAEAGWLRFLLAAGMGAGFAPHGLTRTQADPRAVRQCRVDLCHAPTTSATPDGHPPECGGHMRFELAPD
jgi:hypothetical protein